MTAAAAPVAATADAAAPKAKKGKGKLILMAVPVLLLLIGGGLWFSGILPKLLGMGPKAESAEMAGEHGEHGEHGEKPPPADKAANAPKPPAFVDLPEIISNVNAGPRRNVFVKLHARLEITRAEDAVLVTAAMPRLQDLFETYLREMRPEELRGSAGTWRLREELISRANIAASPAHVVDVLFVDLLVQ